jgi:hypothetical protein
MSVDEKHTEQKEGENEIKENEFDFLLSIFKNSRSYSEINSLDCI